MALTKDAEAPRVRVQRQDDEALGCRDRQGRARIPEPDLKPVLPGEVAPSHPGWVQSVRFTPDEQFLVTAARRRRGSRTSRCGRSRTANAFTAPSATSARFTRIAVTPDGTKLVIGCARRSRKTRR